MSAPRLLAPTTISGGVPTAGAGTLNTIALWTPDGNTLGNSLLTQSGSIVTNASGAIRAAGTTQTSPAFTRHDTTTSGIYFPATNEIGFTISNQHAMFISSGRNVGIGTVSPGQKLNVYTASGNDGIRIETGTNTGTDYAVLRFTQGGGEKAVLYTNLTQTVLKASAGTLDLWGSGSSGIRVDTSGNVGIGTASPYTRTESSTARTTALTSIAAFASMPLTVTDTTAFATGVGGGINFRGQLTSSSYTNFAAIWAARETATNSDYRGSLILATADNAGGYPVERARIDSAGNVGIANTSPSSASSQGRLLVLGDGTGATPGLTIFASAAGSGSLIFANSAGGFQGGFQYAHSLDHLRFITASVTRWVVNNSGHMLANADATYDVGTSTGFRPRTVYATSGFDASSGTGGLKLPATPGNADTQTLDCYQENTGWVPTITFGGASTGMTYTTQAGSWTKIGNLVFVTGRIVLSAKGSSTGVARLANLPVAVGASNASGGGMVGPVANITFGGQLAIYAVASATTLGLAKNTSGGAAVDLTDADFTNTSDITFSCIYRV